jgi:hypothetical protein
MRHKNKTRIWQITMSQRFSFLRRFQVMFLGGVLIVASLPAYASAGSCSKISIQGNVSSGKEWSSPIGQGWVLRLMAVQPAGKYSGWDIVLDRVTPAGFPDAVLLANPPYGSLNEREIATTYGLRAQDAIGWNPRSFRFLTDPLAFHDAQKLYIASHGLSPEGTQDAKVAAGLHEARLLDLIRSASPGELRILDAEIAPGVGDPTSYAQNWAMSSIHTPYQVMPSPSGQATARGALLSIHFLLTLWPPQGWRAPADWASAPAPCAVSSRQR